MFVIKQKTAYEMRISDWSSDVCSSDLGLEEPGSLPQQIAGIQFPVAEHGKPGADDAPAGAGVEDRQRRAAARQDVHDAFQRVPVLLRVVMRRQPHGGSQPGGGSQLGPVVQRAAMEQPAQE